MALVPNSLRIAPVVLALAACGSPGDDTLPDAGADASIDSPPGCTRPALDDPSLEAYVTGVVGQLADSPRFLTTDRNAARTYLMGELSAQGWQPSLHAYATGANVIATIPATMGSGKTIVVGAHFDTVSGSPGANDNASGTAVVLALGRYLKDTPCRTAPVVIALFDQEEQGLTGSRAYALTLTPSNVRAVHTIDQVAWDQDGDSRFELERPTPTLDAEWRAAAAVVGVPVTSTTTQGTDHEAFRDRGFAAVGLTEEYVGGDTSPARHTASDTPQSIAPYTDYLVLAAKLTAQVVLSEVSP
jgi:hypothetical protein